MRSPAPAAHRRTFRLAVQSVAESRILNLTAKPSHQSSHTQAPADQGKRRNARRKQRRGSPGRPGRGRSGTHTAASNGAGVAPAGVVPIMIMVPSTIARVVPIMIMTHSAVSGIGTGPIRGRQKHHCGTGYHCNPTSSHVPLQIRVRSRPGIVYLRRKSPQAVFRLKRAGCNRVETKRARSNQPAVSKSSAIVHKIV